jgi:hypothetical protein
MPRPKQEVTLADIRYLWALDAEVGVRPTPLGGWVLRVTDALPRIPPTIIWVA